MGLKESKLNYLPYEDAIKRVKEDEIKRLRLAFRRASGAGGFMPRQIFEREIFGEFVPPRVVEQIFFAFGGSTKGVSFKDLICGLVLLTRGSREEKVKFIFSIYSSDGTFIFKEDMENMVWACDGGNSTAAFDKLFSQSDQVSLDDFDSWLKGNSSCTALTRWLLEEENSRIFDLGNIIETPTFYQTLAGVTKLSEDDIMILEKKYWILKGTSKTGKFDLETLSTYVCPPIPQSLCEGLFNAFDENKDGNVDFREIACGISACCKGSQTDRQEFCFKIFDVDQDGLLSRDEIDVMVEAMLVIWSENPSFSKVLVKDKESIVNEILEDHDKDKDGSITMLEYQHWSLVNQLPQFFLKILFQVCHVVLGLKPATRDDESKVISGWLERENSKGLKTGDTWHLVSMSWWRNWKQCVCHQTSLRRSSTSSVKRNGTIPYRNNSTSPLANHAWIDTDGSKAAVLRRESHGTFGSSSKVIASDTPVMNGQAKTVANGTVSVMTTPGQIDNNSLVEPEVRKVMILTGEGGKLKKNTPLVCGRDFEIVPDAVWKALVTWYNGGPALPRLVITPNQPESSPELELYPVSLRLFRHVQPPIRTSPISMLNNVTFGLGNWSIGSSLSNPLSPPKRYLAYLATFSRMNTVQQVFEFLCGRLRLKAEDMRLWSIAEENNQYILEDDSKQTLESLNIGDNYPILLEVRNRDMSWPEEMSSLASNRTLKDRSNSVPTEKGATGLNNLGNTCFMNSALQCISNTQPLTIYFNKEYHLYEVNKSNPHGMKGNMARRYGELVQDLWSGNSKTVVPLRLRYTIGRCAPRFNGCQQHDSQEFLSFLLDGLHEDLNRVHEKPYVELKDSDGRPDEVVAQEAWENHLKRNQSVIVDLFHGQLKSQVKSLECEHASVRFDPFTFLSLPLPMDSSILLEITVVRLDGSVPIRYGILLDTDDKYRSLKKELAKHCGLTPTQILLAELVDSTFKNLPADGQKIRSLLGGNLFAFEIPLVPDSVEHAESNGVISDSAKDEEDCKSCRQDIMRNNSQLNITVEEAGSPNYKGSDQSVSSEKSVDSQKRTEKDSPNGLREDTRTSPGLTDSGKRKRSQSPVNFTSKNDYKVGPMPKRFNNNPSPKKKFSGISFDSLLRNNVVKSMDSRSSKLSPSNSQSSNLSNGNGTDQNTGTTPCTWTTFKGFVVALHRRQTPIDTYFVSTQKNQPCLFGVPVVVECGKQYKHCDMYESVWRQVSRLISAPSPGDVETNSSRRYPFELKLIHQDGLRCAVCPWYRFCRGCAIECDDSEFEQKSSYLAVDWDPKTLHLRYQSSQEKVFKEDESVERSRQKQTEPIDLYECLQAFTKEEELGEDGLWYCSKCKKHRLASKKLDIWRLPPVLIIHLKRFQLVNGSWVKSNKVVNFSMTDFDPSAFLVQRCRSAGSTRSQSSLDMGSNHTVITTASDHIVDSGDLSSVSGLVEEATEATEDCTQGASTVRHVQAVEDLETSRESVRKSHSQSKGLNKRDSSHSSNGSLSSGKSSTSRHSSHGSLNKVSPEILDDTPTTTTAETTANKNLSSTSETTRIMSTSSVDSNGSLPSMSGTSNSVDSPSRGECLPLNTPVSTDVSSRTRTGSPALHKTRANSPKSPKYDLYAISSHSGLLGGGHYISYAHNPNHKWYCYNDSSCKECDGERVQSESPYMLFYELQGLDYLSYLPSTAGKMRDSTNDEDDIEETKKSCRLQ